MEWISVRDRKPKLTKAQREPRSFGVQVRIWPPFETPGEAPSDTAFYGCRQTDEPNFYLYGRVIDVTHWMPLPESPREEG